MNIDKYVILDLKKYFNNYGITSESDFEKGFLTLAGTSLPDSNLDFGSEMHINGIPFSIDKNNSQKDNIELEGQHLCFDEVRGKDIHFLSLSCYGSYFQNIHLYLDDQHITSAVLYTADLTLHKPEFPEVKSGLFFDYLHNRKGINPHATGNIWHSTIILDESLHFNKIKFEDNPAIHIFSITIVE